MGKKKTYKDVCVNFSGSIVELYVIIIGGGYERFCDIGLELAPKIERIEVNVPSASWV